MEEKGGAGKGKAGENGRRPGQSAEDADAPSMEQDIARSRRGKKEASAAAEGRARQARTAARNVRTSGTVEDRAGDAGVLGTRKKRKELEEPGQCGTLKDAASDGRSGQAKEEVSAARGDGFSKRGKIDGQRAGRRSKTDAGRDDGSSEIEVKHDGEFGQGEVNSE